MTWGLIGNERAIRVLQSGLGNGSANHAYIFAGPEGTGRATAAGRLAQALNCTAAEPPCRDCIQCRRIESGIHADVQTVTLDSGAEGAARKAIGVEQMRDVEKSVSLAPYEGRVRVVIIDPADLLTGQAQNAFLKTLEEPPPHSVFVLITANDELLLETIRSRCTRVEFRLVPTDDIERALADRGVEADRGKLLARLSGGRPGWAIEALANPKLLERRSEALAAGRALARMSLGDRIDLAEKLSDAFKRERGPVFRQLDEWAGWWRDVLLVQCGAGTSIANIDEIAAIEADARDYRRGDVARFVQSIVETRGILSENVQSRIALDALMLAAPGAANTAPR